MIKIMVDSASDANVNEFDYFVPITVQINGKEYKDGVELDRDSFYDLLLNSKEFPRTSQPSPDSFAEIFEQIKSSGDELIYFSLSSGLSGTYQSATIAKNMVGYDKIYIIDTKCLTHMIGILGNHAKALIEKGFKATEIVEICEELKDKIKVFAGVDTLEYLQKGGRIGKASALLGTIANIKPLVTTSPEGGVDAAGKALGFQRAVQALVEKVKSFNVDTSFPVYLIYSVGEDNCLKLEEKLTSEGFKITERRQVGSTIGAHVGPGVYGVIFVSK